MKEIVLIPAVGLIILGFFTPLVEIAESTSNKALGFAGDMDSAMDCAITGTHIDKCSPELTNTSFEPELNKTVTVLEKMQDAKKEAGIETSGAKQTCIPDWNCSSWSACEDTTTTMTCVDLNGCVESTTSYTMNCTTDDETATEDNTENTTTEENTSTTPTMGNMKEDSPDQRKAAVDAAPVTELKATHGNWLLMASSAIAAIGVALITMVALSKRRSIRENPQKRLPQFFETA